MKGNLRLRNYLKFLVVKLIVSQIDYTSLEMTKKTPILSKTFATYDMEKPILALQQCGKCLKHVSMGLRNQK